MGCHVCDDVNVAGLFINWGQGVLDSACSGGGTDSLCSLPLVPFLLRPVRFFYHFAANMLSEKSIEATESSFSFYLS